MLSVEALALCILSGQVPQEDVPKLCEDNPELKEYLLSTGVDKPRSILW